MSISKNRNRGFTLIELLVVIAVIGVLAAIVFTSVNSARMKARNAKRLEEVRSYSIALALAYDKYGEYPGTVNHAVYCLGDYPNNTCWEGETYGNAVINNVLKEFCSMPIDTYPVPEDGFYGYLYSKSFPVPIPGGPPVPGKVGIYWMMEGVNQSCGVGRVHTANSGGATYCGYEISY